MHTHCLRTPTGYYWYIHMCVCVWFDANFPELSIVQNLGNFDIVFEVYSTLYDLVGAFKYGRHFKSTNKNSEVRK